MTRFGLFILWLLHWLPLAVLAPLGSGLGGLLYWLIPKRRKITLTNLRLCFPDLDEAARIALAKAHFRILTRTYLERGLVWWASERRLRGLLQLEGREHIDAARAAGKPVIILAPHFVGLDAGGSRITMDYEIVSVYSPQNNKVVDAILKHGRSRFRPSLLISRHESLRATVKALREGRPFYYLPDMDFGERDSIFVPFFGVPAATITGVSRLARLTGAVVIPCVTEVLPGGRGYRTRLQPAWTDYPTDDVTADTRRMNAWLEEEVRRLPAQYYWVHKRFKTRPPGAPSLY